MINKFIYIFSYGTLQDERLLNILNVKVYKSYDGILNNYAKFSDTSPYLGIIEYKNKFVTGKVLQIKKTIYEKLNIEKISLNTLNKMLKYELIVKISSLMHEFILKNQLKNII